MVASEKKMANQKCCSGNLTAIGLAFHQYHEQYGTFPPTHILDASGRPIHSWRVLILGVLGGKYEKLYRTYRFSEPWNGPNNRKLAGLIPSLYVCPNHKRNQNEINTNYVAIIRPKKAAQEMTKAVEIPRSRLISDSILVIETNANINWMQPDDSDIKQDFVNKRLSSSGSVMSSFDPEGPAALFVDGTTRRFSVPLSNAELRIMSGASNR